MSGSLGESLRRKVIVAGVGYSEIGRSLGRTEGSLTMEACLRAVSDAGVGPRDVDGVAGFPDRISSRFEGPPIGYVCRSLGVNELSYWQASGTGAAQLSAVIAGTYAIAAGTAEIVLCYRGHVRQEHRFFVPGGGDLRSAAGDQAFRAPYGVPAGAPRYAMWARRYMSQYNLTEEHLASVVLTARAHAQLNASAAWYGRPLTRDEYFESPYVASPLRLVDCDYPIDGAVALVLTTAERADDLPHAPVYIEAVGQGTGRDPTGDLADLADNGSRHAAQQMWSRTDLKPEDVDVAEVYDGFSSLALCWLEDLGFMGRGESGPFLLEGHGRLGGKLPISTDGGQLGVGRLHGFSRLTEAVLQLRGECGARQVENAEVAIASTGGTGQSSAILVTT